MIRSAKVRSPPLITAKAGIQGRRLACCPRISRFRGNDDKKRSAGATLRILLTIIHYCIFSGRPRYARISSRSANAREYRDRVVVVEMSWRV